LNYPKKKPVLFFFHLFQDLEVLIPLMKEAQKQGQPVLAVVHRLALKQYPLMAKTLEEAGFSYRRHEGTWVSGWRHLRGVRAVVTACDSNVPAHRRGHQFVRWARVFGVPTFTTQHGLDNIGLSYTDSEYPAETVRFASRYVLTWGDSKTLLPNLPWSTRKKTIPVGLMKESRKPLAGESLQVSVFENLHWDRYSDGFRRSFLEDLKGTAESFPEVTFILKPHGAGRWMTHRFKGEWKPPANLQVLDPAQPGGPTAMDLITRSFLVITTPSTVAVDSALCDTPVAIVGYDLALKKYEPLPILRQRADWEKVLRTARAQEYPMAALDEFVGKIAAGRNGIEEATKFILARS